MLAPARRRPGHELKQQLLPRTPYTWWVLLTLGSVLWDPSLSRISERYFSLFSGLCSKQGGKGREKSAWQGSIFTRNDAELSGRYPPYPQDFRWVSGLTCCYPLPSQASVGHRADPL